MRSVLIFIGLCSALSARAQDSIYTHFYIADGVNYTRTDYMEKPIASLHYVRPIAAVGEPEHFRAPKFAPLREAAQKMREYFRAEAEKGYQDWGILPTTGPLHPLIAQDLDYLLTDRTAIIAITPPIADGAREMPGETWQMLSVAYAIDGKLPMDDMLASEHYQGFPPIEPEFAPSYVPFMEPFGSLRAGWLFTTAASMKPAWGGDPAEIKTFIRGRHERRDWVPEILHAAVALEALRYGITPLTEDQAATVAEPNYVKNWLAENAEPMLRILGRQNRAYLASVLHEYVYRQQPQRTLRITQVRAECIGDGLANRFVGQYGLLNTRWRFPHPAMPDKIVRVLARDRSEWELHVLREMRHRKGREIVSSTQFMSVGRNLGAYEMQQQCARLFSQMGSPRFTILGTRGAILDGQGGLLGTGRGRARRYRNPHSGEP